MDGEDHVVVPVSNRGLRAGQTLVKELGHGLFCWEGYLCLFWRDGAELNKHGAVDGGYVVQEAYDLLLEDFDFFLVQELSIFMAFGALDFCAVVGGDTFVWYVLWYFERQVLEYV